MPEALPTVRVFLVEDDDSVARAIVDGLARTNGVGYDTLHSRDLRSALKQLARCRFDAAIVDLGLPDAAGPESALKIRGAAPNMPIVALTGEDFEAYGPLLARNGIQDYLQKGEATLRSLDRALRFALERQRLTQAALRRALRDPLTGLVNRGGFERRLKRALHRADRRGERAAVIIADIDKLKSINDGLGHLAGDRLLVAASRSLRAAIRAGDTAARWGGDEFTLILEGLTTRASVLAAGSRARRALNPPPATAPHLAASLGGSVFPDDARTPDSLFKLADVALYQAKARGGGLLVWHEPT